MAIEERDSAAAAPWLQGPQPDYAGLSIERMPGLAFALEQFALNVSGGAGASLQSVLVRNDRRDETDEPVRTHRRMRRARRGGAAQRAARRARAADFRCADRRHARRRGFRRRSRDGWRSGDAGAVESPPHRHRDEPPRRAGPAVGKSAGQGIRRSRQSRVDVRAPGNARRPLRSWTPRHARCRGETDDRHAGRPRRHHCSVAADVALADTQGSLIPIQAAKRRRPIRAGRGKWKSA